MYTLPQHFSWSSDMLKSFGATAAGTLCSVLAPAVPVATACTAMVVADVWSARRLGRRLQRQHPSARQLDKLSSARLGRALATLAKIYGMLAIAAIVQDALVGEWCSLLKFCGGAVCFWQGVSILENEASANPHPWARVVARYVADKTARYIRAGEIFDGINPPD